jgi:hypothetical protein
MLPSAQYVGLRAPRDERFLRPNPLPAAHPDVMQTSAVASEAMMVFTWFPLLVIALSRSVRRPYGARRAS